jgi:signal transduction histidine kinase/CheY-like chemotaxis protein
MSEVLASSLAVPGAAVPDVDARKEVHNLHFTISQSVRNTYSVWFINLFIAIPAWGHVPPWLCVLWVVVVSGAYTLRAYALRPGLAIEVVGEDATGWRRRLNSWTLLCGALAALGPPLFYPTISDILRMYICMLYCCWLAGAMASLGARPRLYAAYAFLFTLGLWVGWLRSDSQTVLPVLVMLFIYALVLSSFARNFARQVDEGVEIRFINDRLIQELTRAREAAEKSSEEKSRFLAVASHDLRQPLHAVTLLNGMLSRPQSAEQVNEISRQMGRSLLTLGRLFNSLLDFSKIEADKVVPHLAWQPLAPLLEQIGQEYASLASQKGLSLTVDTTELSVRTDPQLLERILRNLVDNAIKFTDAGGVALRVSQEPGRLVLSVLDSGPGIPARLREHIFQPYYQQAGGKAQRGLGLGLAIVRGLAERMGLAIRIDDAESGGARFDVVFPTEAVGSGRRHEERPAASPEEVDLRGYFIAYIDDDPSAREALGLLVRDWGCRSVIAASLDEALPLLEGQGTPDVILSDFALAGEVTGLQVIEQMRERYGPVAGAILTGDDSAMRMRLSGELEYPVLSKPVTAGELRAMLEVFKGIG